VVAGWVGCCAGGGSVAGGGGVDADVSGVAAGSRFAATVDAVAGVGPAEALACGAAVGGVCTAGVTRGRTTNAFRTTGAFRTDGRGARYDTSETAGGCRVTAAAFGAFTTRAGGAAA